MNNQPKVLLTIEGIEGATLHSKGIKKIKFIIRKKDLYSNYTKKDADKIKREQILEAKEEAHISKKELRRVIDIFKDEKVNNVEKNKVARTIFKEITKGGNGGKTLKFVFWKQ